MKTAEIEIALMREFDIRRNIIVPNISDWSTVLSFEADLLVLTKSGYATCIEIKVTKSDLKADLKKKHIKRLNNSWKSPYTNKDGFNTYFKNLKHFYYAVPEKLVECALEQIPDFAGLYSIKYSKNKNILSYNVRCVRPAKILFKRKWSESEIFSVTRLGTMRILGLKEGVVRLLKEKHQSKAS